MSFYFKECLDIIHYFVNMTLLSFICRVTKGNREQLEETSVLINLSILICVHVMFCVLSPSDAPLRNTDTAFLAVAVLPIRFPSFFSHQLLPSSVCFSPVICSDIDIAITLTHSRINRLLRSSLYIHPPLMIELSL